MTQALNIDFVSDVACPWCAVGLNSLLQALEQLHEDVEAKIRFRAFELAPDMPAEGERVLPHLCRKYGLSEDQVRQNQAHITERGEALGFVFDFRDDSMKWNTFAAHQLLYWAGEQGAEQQLALKQALLTACFSHNRNPSDPSVLYELAGDAGLDPREARAVLADQRYARAVREQEHQWQQMGVTSVPTVVFNDRFVVAGGQPVEVFADAIRQALEQTASD